jgi:hypothetical protein
MKGIYKEWSHLNGMAEEAQFKVQRLVRAEVMIWILRGAKEEATRRIPVFVFRGLDSPLGLEEHCVGAGVAVRASGRAGAARLAHSALKNSAKSPAQDIATNFDRKMEPGGRPQLEEEACDAKRRSGIKRCHCCNPADYHPACCVFRFLSDTSTLARPPTVA